MERSGGADRVALIEAQRVDLLCAQEVTREAHEQLVASGVFDWSAFSLDHDPPSRRSSRSELLGVAVLGGGPLALRRSRILDWLTRPEKFVVAETELDGWRRPVTIGSYHASPGDGKPQCTLQVAHFFEQVFGPAILGLDANSPDVDHVDHDQSVYHWQQEPYTQFEAALIGARPTRRHRLDDALRKWLADDDSRLAELPYGGALPHTYNRSHRAGTFRGSRFDSVWVSPEFAVTSIEHLWDDDAGRPFGGSDHAMVVTELTPHHPRPARMDVVDHLVITGLVEDGAELRFNVELLPDDDAERVARWIADHPSVGTARFSNDEKAPLLWTNDASYASRDLARAICAAAGVEFPGRPPGPHWWIVASTGQTLVELSDSL